MVLKNWLPLSGIVFVVLALVAVVGIGGSTPGSDASAAKVLSFYDEHTVRQGVAAFILAASVPFLVAFGASLATALWPREADKRPVWQLVLIGGSVLTGAALFIAALIHFALADGGDQRISGDGLQALNVLDNDFWMPLNSAFGVMMLGAAGSLLGAALAYRWLGWVALVLGIALFIPFADFFALLLTLIWIIVASVMLFRAKLGLPVHRVAPQGA
jgi:hypothetical protein